MSDQYFPVSPVSLAPDKMTTYSSSLAAEGDTTGRLWRPLLEVLGVASSSFLLSGEFLSCLAEDDGVVTRLRGVTGVPVGISRPPPRPPRPLPRPRGVAPGFFHVHTL